MRSTTTPAAAQTGAQTTRYDVDVRASRLTFRIRHLFGLATVRGTFALRSGTVDLADPITGSTVWAEIDVSSFQTGNRRRDQNVRSAGFLDSDRHPVITFSANSLDGPTVTGTLTVRDVSRSVTLTIDERDQQDEAITARATARIDRTDFGVSALRAVIGRYLAVHLQIRCVRQVAVGVSTPAAGDHQP